MSAQQEAEIDAAIAEHEAWKAAGRPGLKSHEEFVAEVLDGSWLRPGQAVVAESWVTPASRRAARRRFCGSIE